MLDLVIRSGTVIDGTGAPRFRGDLGIRNGRVVEIGRVTERAARDLDADGLLVTPGFVDIHTHYDGQVSWDPSLTPSSLHGVTTVVMGNCGVGFAPVAPHRHDWLIELMEGVEDIPGSVLAEGITWGWESFPEYLDRIDTPHAIDFAAQVPHDAVRTYVMGDRGAQHESRATADEMAMMRRVVGGAVRAGAIGWSTGRTPVHKTAHGVPSPGLTAPAEELVSLAKGLGDAGVGVISMVSDFLGDPLEMRLIEELALASRRPISVSILQYESNAHTWRAWMDEFAAISARTGVPVRGQVSPRALGAMMGWELSWHPFMLHPTFRSLARLPSRELVAALRRPEVRRAILAEQPEGEDPQLLRVATAFDRIFALSDPPDYEPEPDQSLAARARLTGRTPQELAYDAMLEADGTRLLYYPIVNYTGGNLDDVGAMLARADTVIGLGDAGAHCRTICDASFPTTLLTLWGRDRRQGPRFELEWLVKRQTADGADAVGLSDRGRLLPGLRADLNLIDFERLSARYPVVAHDLPGGGRRLMQGATGYQATIVAGQIVVTDGQATGALPGRLVRGAR